LIHAKAQRREEKADFLLCLSRSSRLRAFA